MSVESLKDCLHIGSTFCFFGKGKVTTVVDKVPRLYSGIPVRNEVLIGWDGCLIDDVRLLLEQGRLPNLQRLIDEGCMIDTYITTSKTETKPGWAEILTGYGPGVTGVTSAPGTTSS